MASKVENIYLVNAPAGSGKTTKIKSMIVNHMIRNPIDNILCITYTRRAAEELTIGLTDSNIDISTIHSFLHKFIKIYFNKEEVKDLYIELYNDLIEESINNEEGKEHITKKNERFIDAYGELRIETIRSNLTSLYYNESSNNHLYKGGLSHDSLIHFAQEMFNRFPKMKLRLTQKYQMIFIDEYQDSASSVLKMFYQAGLNTQTKIYFLGDKMQQIYKNYDGTFETQLKTLNTEIKLEMNHRSVKNIVDVLNNIYNDDNFEQKTSAKNQVKVPKHVPRILICKNVHDRLEKEHLNQPEALLLYLLNSKRFESIGATNLYDKFKRLDRYSFSKQLSPAEVLNGETVENPDPLLKILFIFESIFNNYEKQNLGSIIQIFKRYRKIFKSKKAFIISHTDRVTLAKELTELFNAYQSDVSINEFLNELKSFRLFNNSFLEEISEEYHEVVNVKLSEFKALSRYLGKPKVSTQHGVKGESHDSVFFIAENSVSTPVVHMYNFFELWTKTELSLDTLESFYYEYMEWIDEVTEYIGCKPQNINAENHKKNKEYLDLKVNELCKHYDNHQIFKELCIAPYNKYVLRPTATNFKQCFKENTIYGTLSAYRLFYVGCSRSRENLTVFIEKQNVEGYLTELKTKFESIGFTVEVYDY